MFLFLIGMPGVGKSYWHKKFAEVLGYPSIDLDEYIEKQSGKSISELIGESETNFRTMESNVLREIVAQKQSAVIATGGGTACFHDNLFLMKKSGVVLFISRPIDSIVRKMMKDKNQRPLVDNSSEKSLSNYLEQTFSDRKYFYEQASIIFEPEKDTFKVISLQVKKLLQHASSNL